MRLYQRVIRQTTSRKMGDTDPTTMEEYRALTPQQRKNVRKPALQALIESVAEDNGDGSGVTQAKLDEILEEVRGIKDKFKKANDEIERLDKIVNDQTKILTAQQKFLENIDSERRGQDLIVLGAIDDGDDDGERFNRILNAIEIQPTAIRIKTMKRLGVIDEQNEERRRPIKVTFESRMMRDNVLKNAKKLKNLEDEDPLKKIFLKPDVHPEVRKEEKRLYDVFKVEKNKPDNADFAVVYDRKKRIVTVNGEEIDRFRLFSSSFQ